MLTQFLSSYSDYHYKFLVFASEHGAEEEQQYIEELLSYQIEGLIVLSHTLPSEKLASYQIPVIAIEREAEYISSVNTDNYMGALQATSLLIRDKCDILIHINVNVNKSIPAYDRIRAFQATCEEYHIPYDICRFLIESIGIVLAIPVSVFISSIIMKLPFLKRSDKK